MEDTVFTRNLVGEGKKKKNKNKKRGSATQRQTQFFFLVSMLHVGNQLHLILMKKRRDKDILICR